MCSNGNENIIEGDESCNLIDTQNNVFDGTVAVEVKNVNFKFRKSDKEFILKNINMNIREGSIYGLLGSSGCGKTTLLRCIVGRLKPNSGKIHVFGTIPGQRNALIPGPGIGYMPQELALYNNFTIYETLYYFGTINGMDSQSIKSSTESLLQFLQLPNPERSISKLSGGQKRRVSLASALVHKPPLLILDEPTVGVDTLLRQRIWEHLIHLTRNEGITVIITTHYIEEARGADTIGFIRKSTILLEKNPSEILADFNTTSLEDAVLQISRFQEGINNHANDHDSNRLSKLNQNEVTIRSSNESQENRVLKLKPENHEKWLALSRMKALLYKNLIQLQRNLVFIIFALILPALLITIFCTVVGDKPYVIKMGVYNPHPFNTSYNIFLSHSITKNNSDVFGSDILKMTYYSSVEEAIDSVKSGHNWGALIFGDDFVDAIIKRINCEPIYNVDDQIIENSTIKLYADMTNFLIFDTMIEELSKLMNNFSRELISIFPKSNPNTTKSIVEPQKPVYGTDNPNFKTYTAPGIILSLAFMIPLLLTTVIFVKERKDGQFERSLISGINPLQISITYLSAQILVMTCQIVVLLLTALIIFDLPIEGSFCLAVALPLLQGIAGVCFGLLISSVCDEEQTAIFLAFGSFYASILLSGVFWPLEAMTDVVRGVSYSQPQTLAIVSLRAITLRGWGLQHFEVWIGFVSTLVWIMIYVIGTIIAISCKT